MTHLALLRNDKMRYLISFEDGKKKLTQNICSYSKKLHLMMLILRFIPINLIIKLKCCECLQVELKPEVNKFIKSITLDNQRDLYYNIIIGTYNKQQKIVIQCYDLQNKGSLFFKIGNNLTNRNLLTEINFLKEKHHFRNFKIPKYISSQTIAEGYNLNIIATAEFCGKRVKPLLNEEIYNIYLEIININTENSDNNLVFSHGDFTPWNMRRTEDTYWVFDWEHCGYRFIGYDLIHFLYQINRLLKKMNSEQAITDAYNELHLTYGMFENIALDTVKQLYFDERYKTFGTETL